MKPDCEYCGAVLPEGVDKRTRQIRSAHFMQHAAERKKEDSGVHFTAHNTVDTRPEALRLAEALDSQHSPTVWNHSWESAAELRRLHALCDEMGEALEAAQTPLLHLYNAYGWPDKAGVRGKVDNALAKWKESK